MTEVATAPVTTEAPVATEASPPNHDMTGDEARAWVESQKASKASTAGKAVKEAVTANTMKEAIAEAKKYKVKVDGQDLEVDEHELIRGYGHQKAANKLLQEGKLARKQAEEFINMMKDPETFFEVAKKLGHDPRTLAEKKLAAELEYELMDPRDRELKEVRQRLAAREAEDAKVKAEQESKMHEALKAKYSKDYSDQFVAALKETGLPPTKVTVADMARYVSRAAQIGFKMSASEAAQLVKEDIQQKTQRLFAEADGDVLINLLGEQVANKVRKWDTSRLRSPEQMLRTPTEQADPSTIKPRGTPKHRMTSAEWRDFNRK